MPLQAQTTAVPLYGGLDTKTDPKFVAPNHTLTAQNVQYFGVSRCRKRYGQTALTQNIAASGASIGTGKALGVFNSELLEYDGTNMYAYATAQGSWFNRGALTEALVNRTPIVRTSGSVGGIASGIAGVLEAYAWEDTRGGVWYALRDPVSGTFAIPNSQLDVLGGNPQIVVSGAFLYIFYSSGTTIKAAKLAYNNPAGGIVSTFLITNDFTASTSFAVAATTTQVAVVWQSGTANTWNSTLLDAMLTPTAFATTSFTAPASYYAQLAYLTTGTDLLLTVAGSGSIVNYPINTATAAFGTPQTTAVTGATKAVAVGLTATTAQMYVNVTATGTAPLNIQSYTVTFPTAATVTLGSPNIIYGLGVASQPIVRQGIPYLIANSALVNAPAGATSQQTSFFLLSAASGVVPTILERFSGAIAYTSGVSLPLLVQNSTGQLFVGLGERTSLRSDATGTIFSQVGLTSTYFSFPSTSNFKAVSFGGAAVIECGATYSYDGSTIVESGFWEFPDGITATPAAYGGTGLNQGLYIYQVTYEWVDAAGNNHYSAPSYPISATTTQAGQSNQVTLVIPYTALTRKAGANVCIYRTATAATNPSTQDSGLGNLYKIATVSNDPGIAGTATFSYVDVVPDSAAVGQQIIYSPFDGSGEIENDPPPPFAFMVATKTRVFGIAQDDGTALWYSKPLAPNRPAEFSSAQIIRIETDGGAVTALGFLDTQAIIFKRRRIYYLPGDGPNAAGAGSLFPDLQLIASTSGCISQPSVLSTHEGIFYKSEIGIQVLDRSLSIDPNIGLPVQGFNSLTLSGALPATDQNQLRWTSSDGTALVYDYVTKRWATYSNYDSVGYVVWNSTYARLRTNGQVLFEDQATYLDNGQAVQMILETSWLKPTQMAQGFAAVWYAEILGQYFTSHQLRIETSYDYIDVPMQINIWNAAVAVDSGTYGSGSPYGSDVVYGSSTLINTAQYQLRVALQRQVCEAIKFKISDVSITGQSCDLYEIALQLGVIGGLNRVPVKQQV